MLLKDMVLPTQACDKRDRERSQCSKGTVRRFISRKVINAMGRQTERKQQGRGFEGSSGPNTGTDSKGTQKEGNQGSYGRIGFGGLKPF